MDFLKKLANWSPLALFYFLFDKSGQELGKAVVENLTARYEFTKDKAGYYATRALAISLGLLIFSFLFYTSQWYILSVICGLVLSAAFVLSLVIVKTAIPEKQKKSLGGGVRVLLYAVFLIFVTLPLTLATTLMPWNSMSVIVLFFMWVLAVVAYSAVKGEPVSAKPLKVIMTVIAVAGIVYSLFLSTGAVGDALERFRVSYQLRVAAFFSSLSKGMDEGESPYDPVLYMVREDAPIYKLRMAFGKVVSAEPTATADEDTIALATNVPFIKGLQELAIVQFANKKTGQYIGGKESWVGIAKQDLISLKSLQQAQQSALATQQAAAMKPYRIAANFQPDSSGLKIAVENANARDVTLRFSSGDQFRTAWMGGPELILRRPALWLDLVAEDSQPVSGRYDQAAQKIEIL